MQLLLILGIPVAIALINFLIFNKKVPLAAMGLQVLGICVLMGGIAFGCSASKKHDTEIVNGHVTSKTRNEVSCRHGYPCNPHPCMCDDKGNDPDCGPRGFPPVTSGV